MCCTVCSIIASIKLYKDAHILYARAERTNFLIDLFPRIHIIKYRYVLFFHTTAAAAHRKENQNMHRAKKIVYLYSENERI